MAAAKGFADDHACVDWLLSGAWDSAKAELCADYLTIGETYFFREPRAFDLIADYARDKIARVGTVAAHLRIWSAGCCTGEEPYSIAMHLRQAVPQLDARRIAILGTDINARSLQAAREGVYRQWSFRGTDTAMRRRFFSEEGDGCCRLHADIRSMVRFAELNLAAAGYPCTVTGTQALDIVFCRNVLMYFSKRRARQVIARLRECLVDGGWLIVNPSEASAELFEGFSPVYYPDAVYFRKDGPIVCAAVAEDDAMPDPVSVPLCPHSIAIGAADEDGEAVQPLKQAVGPDAAAVDEYHASALAAMEAGDYQTALQDLKRVIYLQPDRVIAYYLMGIIHTSQGRQRIAARQFGIASDLLDTLRDDDPIPGSDGFSVASLRQAINFRLPEVA
jgi:chemotaxis protein methyltransferase CheR